MTDNGLEARDDTARRVFFLSSFAHPDVFPSQATSSCLGEGHPDVFPSQATSSCPGEGHRLAEYCRKCVPMTQLFPAALRHRGHGLCLGQLCSPSARHQTPRDMPCDVPSSLCRPPGLYKYNPRTQDFPHSPTSLDSFLDSFLHATPAARLLFLYFSSLTLSAPFQLFYSTMVSTRPKNKNAHPAAPVMTKAAKEKVGIKTKPTQRRVTKDQTIRELQARLAALENPSEGEFSKEPLVCTADLRAHQPLTTSSS